MDLVLPRTSTLKVLVLLAAMLFSPEVSAQFMGLPSIKIYSFQEYGAGGQNYQIEQSEDGLIYVANNFGLLSFDGTFWQTDSVDGGTKIRSVFPANDGKIYVGAQNELGFYAPDANGFMAYTSLKHLIDESFEDVWKIHQTRDGLCFSTTGQTFILNDSSFEVLQSSPVTGFTATLGDILLTRELGKPVTFLENKEWKIWPDQPQMDGAELVSIVRLREGGQLWFSRQGCRFWKDGQEKAFLAPDLAELLSTANISKAIQLLNGSIAIATTDKGLFIADSRSGELILQLNGNNGLNGHTVYDVMEDERGSMWLGMNNNIVRVSWSYPFSFINGNLGVPGTGYTAEVAGNQLYLGTNTGLYVREMTDKEFTKVEGIEGQVNNIQEIDGQVLISGHEGVFQVTGLSVRTIDRSEGWWGMLSTSDPDLFIAGTYTGLALFDRSDGNWRLVKKYDQFKESSRVLAFDPSGHLWMTHGYKGVYRFRFSDSFEQIEEVTYFGPESGLPSKYLNNVFETPVGLVFTAETGIFQFEPNSGQFVRHEYLDTLIGASVHTRIIESTAMGDTYVITRDFSALLKTNQWTGITLNKNIFKGIHHLLNDDLTQISVINDHNVLFSANEGFIHYNNDYGLLEKDLKVLIRSVSLTNQDSLIFGGYGQQSLNSVELPYLQNSLAFTYSAVDYQSDHYEYRYRLEGYHDGNWSAWTDATLKEFTNLYEGNYSFQIQAKDALGNESNVIQYDFEVLPPWFRSTWAYIGLVFSVMLILFFSAAWYRQRHKREQKRLIAEQKHELDIRDKELVELRNEKLKAEINTKKKELATSTMHLIDKNEFMGQIKTHLIDVKKAMTEDAGIVKKLNKLIKDIDKNIDQDRAWKQFEINFDQVHGDFLKTIQTDYPVLSPQDLKLCAYLRMNMSTKEIANLLKISVRGVEIARYRLRKKLDLSHEKNLVDFMIKYGTEQQLISSN